MIWSSAMHPLRLYLQHILSVARARPWFTLACLLVAIGALLMIAGGTLGVRMFGAWMTLLVTFAGLLGFWLHLSMQLAGPPPTSEQPFSMTNSRSSTVFFAILAGSIASPKAVNSVGVFISAILEALFVKTPNTVMNIESVYRTESSAQKVGLALSELFNSIQKQLLNNKADATSWTVFFIVFGAMLLLGRALSQSHAALDERAAAEGAPPPKKRPIVMTYPKWLALCLYCLILAPATYFSLGALLWLGTDTESRSVSVSEALAAAAKPDSAPAPLFAFSGVPASQKKLTDSEQSETRRLADEAVGNLRVGQTALEAWQARYEAQAIDVILAFTPLATPDQVDSEVAHMTALFRGELTARRAQMRGCLADLADLQVANASRGALEIARSAQSRCAAFAGGVRPDAVRSAEAKPGIHHRLYAWMAHASESAVLIIGLVGFGLFGAAIRMMGRPDRVTVTESELIAARSKAEEQAQAAKAAILETKTARLAVDNAKLALDQPASSAPVAVKNALDQAEDVLKTKLADEALFVQRAKDSEQAFLQLERAAVEDRSNFVIERRVLSPKSGEPKSEFVLSGAPAKVLVSGLGAAFTVFLAGKAGVQIFTEGGTTSPTGLLLACFVGAVFAEDIWLAVRKSIERTGDPAEAS